MSEPSVARPEQFRLDGALPSGTTVIEASAGTGKTYALVGLATRYLAEGVVGVADLLMVTFSRAATDELKDRARARILEAAAALEHSAAARRHPDPVIAYLADADEDELALRRRRLAAAVADFDAATIVTTHGFSEAMLRLIGLAGPFDPDARLAESVDELVDQVIADLYAARYAGAERPPMTFDDASRLARAAVADPSAHLVPADAAPERVHFATAVREQLALRKRALGIRDFNDLLVLLDGALSDGDRGPLAVERIRERFSVLLVDEFQDTDPLQWSILSRLFHGQRTLVLVGDPKQAIYAFRGADVQSYLAATALADSRLVLDTNWRSAPALVGALGTLLGGAELGDPRITVVPLHAGRAEGALGAGVRIRVAGREAFPSVDWRTNRPTAPVARSTLARDAAVQIAADLAGGTPAGDIAVLVRSHAELDAVAQALGALGVPAVRTGGTSLFDTAAADDWLRMLIALEDPSRRSAVVRAALTPLGGLTTEQLAVDDDALTGFTTVLRDAAAVFARDGFFAMFDELAGRTGLMPRLLGVGAERELTDLRQLAELLEAQRGAGDTLTDLRRVLRRQIDGGAAVGRTQRSRRLDSDRAAVQLLTMHAAKGLEFPVVYLPFVTASGWWASDPLRLHEGHRRVLDVGTERDDPRGWADRKRVAEAEAAAEDLRLLYVALTRAGERVVLWWAPTRSTEQSALHRMLFGRSRSQVAMDAVVPPDADVLARLRMIAGHHDAIEVEAVAPAGEAPRLGEEPEPVAAEPIRLGTFTRNIDRTWRRTSYSTLTAGAHGLAPAAAVLDPDLVPDEPVEPDDEPSEAPHAAAALASPFTGFPGGTAFGSLVHEILEYTDTETADLRLELEANAVAALAGEAEPDPAALAQALAAVMATPLRFAHATTTLGAMATEIGWPSWRSSCRLLPTATRRVWPPSPR